MRDNRRGAALLMGYLFIALVAAYGSATVVRSLTEQNAARQHARLFSAFYVAEAGVDRAVLARTAIPYTAWLPAVSPQQGGYEVSLDSLLDQDPPYEQGDPIVPGRMYQMTSTGHYPSNVASTPGYQRRQIEFVVSLPTFDYGLFAKEGVTLHSHALIDSYDSREGAYGGHNLGTDGDIGSNSTQEKTIELKSHATLKGDAVVGPNGDVNTAIEVHQNATLTGERQVLPSERDVSPETFPAGYATGPLAVGQGQTQTLPGGTHRFSLVQLDNNARVEVTGDATIYVEGDFELKNRSQFVTNCNGCTVTLYVNDEVELKTGSVLSAGNQPTHLVLVVTSNGEVKLHNDSKVYGSIHAPLSAIELKGNGAELFGAAIGKEVALKSHAKVHHDVALGGGNGGGGTTLLSWRDL